METPETIPALAVANDALFAVHLTNAEKKRAETICKNIEALDDIRIGLETELFGASLCARYDIALDPFTTTETRQQLAVELHARYRELLLATKDEVALDTLGVMYRQISRLASGKANRGAQQHADENRMSTPPVQSKTPDGNTTTGVFAAASGSPTRREYTDGELKHWWVAECPECKWTGLSRDAEGGHAMADTGDFNDVVCPVCIHTPEGKWMGRWVVVNEVESGNDPAQQRATNDEPSTESATGALAAAPCSPSEL